MGIPPDDYPIGQDGWHYAGTTSFDAQKDAPHVQSAEIRGKAGEDIVSLFVTVIPPEGRPSVPLKGIVFNVVNDSEPQIAVDIQTPDGSAISDGYKCQFAFQSIKRALDK